MIQALSPINLGDPVVGFLHSSTTDAPDQRAPCRGVALSTEGSPPALL